MPHDNLYLNAIRNLDVETLIDMDRASEGEAVLVKTPNIAPVALGLLTLKFFRRRPRRNFGLRPALVSLIFTKSRQSLVSYVAAGIASGPSYPVRIPHVRKESLELIFDEGFRSDLLKMTRQTCASILDLTAAKPPALTNREAAKPWPVYISLYSPEGRLGGQAGTHVPVGPLEESIRQFAFEAVRAAKANGLSKETFKNWVVDMSIPHGFNKFSRPEDLIPLLNGLIVTHEHRKSAFHPDAWRTYPITLISSWGRSAQSWDSCRGLTPPTKLPSSPFASCHSMKESIRHWLLHEKSGKKLKTNCKTVRVPEETPGRVNTVIAPRSSISSLLGVVIGTVVWVVAFRDYFDRADLWIVERLVTFSYLTLDLAILVGFGLLLLRSARCGSPSLRLLTAGVAVLLGDGHPVARPPGPRPLQLRTPARHRVADRVACVAAAALHHDHERGRRGCGAAADVAAGARVRRSGGGAPDDGPVARCVAGRT